MEYRQLGRSGLRVSKMCLGTMNFGHSADAETAEAIVAACLDAGINFIDTANVYGRGQSEEITGNAIAKTGRRDEIVLATKVVAHMGKGPNDHGASRFHIVQQCDASLKRLCTDRIDLYQLHIVDPTTPPDETMSALDDLVRQGKVRYIGTSKHAPSYIMEYLGISERRGYERFVSEQPPYSLLDRSIENELVWMCLRQGIGIIPWGPLATGILSGQYRKGEAAPEGSRAAGGGINDRRLNDKVLDTVERLRPLADAKDVTLAEFSLGWVTNQPGITAPIFGARTVEHVEAAVRASEVTFTPDELAAIDEIVPPGTAVSDYYDMNVYSLLRSRVKSGQV